MATCTVNKHLKRLGTGSITAGSNSVTGWTTSGALSPMVGRNVWVTITHSQHADAPPMARANSRR